MNLRRIPISGWKRCVHSCAVFDSEGEFHAADLLDKSAAVEWWLRNDPSIFKISTPAGDFEPDFLYSAKRGSSDVFGILEIKGGIFWNGPDSLARIKSGAARKWVASVNRNSAQKWEYAIALDVDALSANSLEELRRNALEIEPKS